LLLNIFLVYKSSENKTLENVKLREIEKIPKGLAIMLETEHNSDDYEESNTSSWPKTGYKFNKEKSGCIDNSGSTIENSLSYDSITNIVTVDTGVTTKCYIYFDLKTLEDCEDTLSNCLIEYSDDLWDSTLEDDGYRFVGTNPDNYICFGTYSKEMCTSDTDKYMYRIIGIFEDNEGNQHLKLIKKEALNTAYSWHSSNSDVDWNESDLYKGINGEYFLTNTSYPYMQDNIWLNKISIWEYTMTNTKSTSGPHYYYTSTQALYLHELNKNSKSSQVCNKNATDYDSSICDEGIYNNLNTKVSLMYASDYQLSLGNSILNLAGYLNESTLKTGWIHISNNDSQSPSDYEWTMTRYGYYPSGNYHLVWTVYPDGRVGTHHISAYTYSSRPVFYLNTEEKYVSGDGTIDNPIIIKETASETIIRKDTEKDIGLQQEIIEGDDLYRFSGTQGNTGINNYVCLGTTSKCSSGTDYMYRIIGVNPSNGEIKVIKETPWNSSATYAWHSSNSSISWLTSALYTGTVSGIYDSLSFNSMIVTDHSWNVGTAGSTSIATRESVIDYENNTTGTANIGIMSLTDYYLAYNGDRNWYSDYDITTNWIGGYLNGNTSNYEWTMTYYGQYSSSYCAWNVYYDYGYANCRRVTDPIVVRPVFYLKKDVYITNPEATGSSDDPFIISY